MIELHCHSNASDGSLTPTELVELAHKNGITDLALTDHDSIAGIAEAEAVAAPLGMNIIPGTELSCEFGSGELHIVGLFIDTKCPALKQFYDDLYQYRLNRNKQLLAHLQNIGIDRLNLFNLYTGVKGQEWDGLYLYQGYYHFVSAYISILNLPARFGIGSGVETLKGTVWGMGLLYSLVSGALIINIVDILPIKSRWMKRIFAVFALFYLNLYYWRVVFAFYGNTYRSLLITFLMFMIYEREAGVFPRRVSAILLMLISFAGIACSRRCCRFMRHTGS